MKPLRVILAVILCIVVLQGLAFSALAGPPAGTWITGIQVQNLDPSADAHVTLTFYWAAGTALEGQVAATATATIAPNKMTNFHVPSLTQVPANFVGSVVVSSDVEVAATIITTNTGAGTNTDPKRVGAAAGVSAPSTTVYAPFLRKAYYGRNSYIAVQNTADAAATVYLTYIDHNGSTVGTGNASVPAYSTRIFYQNDTALPTGFHGSAVITSTVPLAVLVNDANSGADASSSGFESYNGFSAGATKIYLPKLSVNYYSYDSGFQIQNVGNVEATMTITYTFGATNYTKTSPSILPGQAWTVFLGNRDASGIPVGVNGSASAIVTSLQPMVAVVSERNLVYGFEVISAGVADGSGTDTVIFPKFNSQYYDYESGIQVQNVGTAPTRMQATFSMAGHTDVIVTSDAIAPGASAKWHGPAQGLGPNWVGSVVVVSLDSQPIAGVLTDRNIVLKGDTYSSYNGINN
ncbi:MAG: hypothetical protein ACYC6L_08705 [Anaerolineae bacterium]